MLLYHPSYMLCRDPDYVNAMAAPLYFQVDDVGMIREFITAQQQRLPNELNSALFHPQETNSVFGFS